MSSIDLETLSRKLVLIAKGCQQECMVFQQGLICISAGFLNFCAVNVYVHLRQRQPLV